MSEREIKVRVSGDSISVTHGSTIEMGTTGDWIQRVCHLRELCGIAADVIERLEQPMTVPLFLDLEASQRVAAFKGKLRAEAQGFGAGVW